MSMPKELWGLAKRDDESDIFTGRAIDSINVPHLGSSNGKLATSRLNDVALSVLDANGEVYSQELVPSLKLQLERKIFYLSKSFHDLHRATVYHSSKVQGRRVELDARAVSACGIAPAGDFRWPLTVFEADPDSKSLSFVAVQVLERDLTLRPECSLWRRIKLD